MKSSSGFQSALSKISGEAATSPIPLSRASSAALRFGL